MGLIPILVLTEALTIVANEFLGIDPFLKVVTTAAIALMSFALVGLATGLGARYPRFSADNASQVAGSYGGVTFMIFAVLFILVTIVLLGWPSTVLLFQRQKHLALTVTQQVMMAGCFAGAVALSIVTWLMSMRIGVKALQEMGSV
jgi:hypothetical protein